MENSGMSKRARVKKEQIEERRSEVTDDNEGMLTIKELNKVLNMQTTGKVAG